MNIEPRLPGDEPTLSLNKMMRTALGDKEKLTGYLIPPLFRLLIEILPSSVLTINVRNLQ
jgi:hypothetical protein